MLQRFLLLWLTVLGLLAYFSRQWLANEYNPLLLSAPGLRYLFAVTMLAVGSLLPHDEIRRVAQRWPTVLGGTAIQYASMPFLAYGMGRLFGLEGAWLAGVIMVGCVPGAMASNVLTLVARGNVSYSVSLTASATLLSPLVVPFALWIALSQWVEISVLKESWQLCWMVVIPVVAGHLLSRRNATWNRVATRWGPTMANLAILWIIAVIVADKSGHFSDVGARLLLALLAINVGGYLIGTVGGYALRVTGPMRRALTLEIGMQNAGLGAVLAQETFGEQSPEAIVPTLYMFGCMFTGTLLARLWAEFGGQKEQAVGGE